MKQLSLELVPDLPPLLIEVQRLRGAVNRRSLVHSYGMGCAPVGRWIVAVLGHKQPRNRLFRLNGEVA